MITLHCKVAGVTFDGRQDVLARLKGNEPIRLEPEPTNTYDPNAIAVKVALNDGVFHCGYIPREIASRLAPVMDGENFMCNIEEITGGFELFSGGTAAYGLRLKLELPDPIRQSLNKKIENDHYNSFDGNYKYRDEDQL